jgi:radical SAM superfamily enzyme YgiQ (UPF0313 family)
MHRNRSPIRSVWLVQLPIPPLGPEPIRGNVPLAAAYLKLWAEGKGLRSYYDIQLFPPAEANVLGDRALVAALADREPWLVGFTCYVWNIERTLWIARELKQLRPEVRIVLGGPEITADNEWVLATDAYDFAVIGEGEQTFTQLLLALLEDEAAQDIPIAGLYLPPASGPRFDPARCPAFRTPMPDLNALGSPYRAGILDVADEEMLLLETIRGCRFQCKFCYYPKAYDTLYFLAPEAVRVELAHAAERGAREVVLLDPTLNQRKNFAAFLRLLADGNPGQCFRYFGELRAEGITDETAALLRHANFTEVEVGLQSIEPEAMTRMDRKNNLHAFERGVRAMLREGIKVKVDLIVGLPGDTIESVRRGLHYVRDQGLYAEVQVFHLSVLPGTAFRHEAASLGLRFQTRPPYYVLKTPTLTAADIFGLLEEAQDVFELEFDAPPPPVLTSEDAPGLSRTWRVDLDHPTIAPPPAAQAQAFTLWLRSSNFTEQTRTAIELVRRVLQDNPFTTLQIALEPKTADIAEVCTSLDPDLAAALMEACQQQPTYLDKYYAMHPGVPRGAKRLIVLLASEQRDQLPSTWLAQWSDCATIAWRGPEAAELVKSNGTATMAVDGKALTIEPGAAE